MKNYFFICLMLFLAATSCQNKKGQSANTADSTTAIKPAGPAPAWAPDMKPEMVAVIEKLQSYGEQPIETLGVGQARKNHTPADAVNDLIKQHHIPAPVYNVDTTGKDIPAAWGNIHLRIYTPKNSKSNLPVIVYYHGGGFVIGSIKAYDASANILADKTGAIVVSVGYRLAPQYKYPYAHNDAFTAYQWVIKNAASIKGDSTKIAVAGESAGGNLAMSTAIKARDKKTHLPSAILAIYPIAGADMKNDSYQKYSDALPLSRPMMSWFFGKYLNKLKEMKDPLIDLVNSNLTGLPPTIIITDEIDPLQSEGLKLADKLKADGVTVYAKNYDGVTHEFFGMGAIVPQARDAEQFAADNLKKLLAIK
jgi:acetyl esterase/lipase